MKRCGSSARQASHPARLNFDRRTHRNTLPFNEQGVTILCFVERMAPCIADLRASTEEPVGLPGYRKEHGAAWRERGAAPGNGPRKSPR